MGALMNFLRPKKRTDTAKPAMKLENGTVKLAGSQRKRYLPDWLSIGRRGTVLLFLSMFYLVIGQGNRGKPIDPQDLKNAHYILLLAPLQLWTWIWTLAGLLCLVATFWRKLESWAFFWATLVPTVFSLGYFAATLFYSPAERAWVIGVLFSGIAVLAQVVAGWEDHSRRVK